MFVWEGARSRSRCTPYDIEAFCTIGIGAADNTIMESVGEREALETMNEELYKLR